MLARPRWKYAAARFGISVGLGDCAACGTEAGTLGWAAGTDWPRTGETPRKTSEAAATVSQEGKVESFVFIIQRVPSRLDRLDGRTARSSWFKGGEGSRWVQLCLL